MAVANFVPTIWTAKLFTRLRKAHVFGNLVNTDYEGEISPGASVKINEIGAITVSNYTAHSDLSYEALNSAQKTLLIDQQKYFAFEVDDVEQVQTKPKLMNGAMDEAAYAISDTIDSFIAGKYSEAAAIDTTNLGTSGTAVTLYSTSGNVLTVLSYASRVLSDKNVPQAGRWMVVTPWFQQKLVQAASGALTPTATPKLNERALIDGFIGNLWGFDIFVSNNVPTAASSVYAVTFGNRQAISYAGQINKIEATRLEKRFADGVKGLYVYGAKVVRPEALGVMYVTEGA